MIDVLLYYLFFTSQTISVFFTSEYAFFVLFLSRLGEQKLNIVAVFPVQGMNKI